MSDLPSNDSQREREGLSRHAAGDPTLSLRVLAAKQQIRVRDDWPNHCRVQINQITV
jgi:hypothetical protein